jgi:hypothetical protein
LTLERGEKLNRQLRDWYDALDSALRVHGQTTSAVYVLQFVHLNPHSENTKLILPSVYNTTPLSFSSAGLLPALVPPQRPKRATKNPT